MERNNQNRPEYYGNYNGERVYFNPDNTLVYLHKETPGADHLFVVIDNEGEEEPSQSGFYVWRALHSDVFPKMVEDLIADGCNLIALDRVSDFDANNLAKEVETIPDGLESLIASAEIKNPEPEPQQLTPRQENLVNFLGYLLLHGHITTEEFNNASGEIYL